MSCIPVLFEVHYCNIIAILYAANTIFHFLWKPSCIWRHFRLGAVSCRPPFQLIAGVAMHAWVARYRYST